MLSGCVKSQFGLIERLSSLSDLPALVVELQKGTLSLGRLAPIVAHALYLAAKLPWTETASLQRVLPPL